MEASLTDTKGTESMSIKHHELARQACFLAKSSSDWASDLLTLPECVNDPVRPDSVERYLVEMRMRLDIIESMHNETDNVTNFMDILALKETK